MSRTTVVINRIKENIENVSGYGMGLTPDIMESIEVITNCYANDRLTTSDIVDKFLKEIKMFNFCAMVETE